MTMRYAQTLAETAEAGFLRFRKLTADARPVQADPKDLYDMLQLGSRTGRILPNGWCMLPPRQSRDRGNACLTCGKFAADATFLPELRVRKERTLTLIDSRQAAFTTRTGTTMTPGNVWLDGRRREADALGAIITALESAPEATQAAVGAGTAARADAAIARQDERRPGNTENLRKATEARTAAAAARAENTLVAMISEGEPVTFRGLAARAGVSLDFLYRNAGIRSRIEQHRTTRPARPEPAGDPGGEHASSVVRTLTAQLADLKRRHREETAELRQALEQAHGGNLLLRRRPDAGGQAEAGQ